MCKGQDLDDPHPEYYFLTLVRKASDILRVGLRETRGKDSRSGAPL